jgi:hypothetical protein
MSGRCDVGEEGLEVVLHERVEGCGGGVAPAVDGSEAVGPRRCRRLREGAAWRGPAGAGRHHGCGHADDGAAADGATEWRGGPVLRRPSALTGRGCMSSRSRAACWTWRWRLRPTPGPGASSPSMSSSENPLSARPRLQHDVRVRRCDGVALVGQLHNELVGASRLAGRVVVVDVDLIFGAGLPGGLRIPRPVDDDAASLRELDALQCAAVDLLRGELPRQLVGLATLSGPREVGFGWREGPLALCDVAIAVQRRNEHHLDLDSRVSRGHAHLLWSRVRAGAVPARVQLFAIRRSQQ